jgi:hypothetical protein
LLSAQSASNFEKATERLYLLVHPPQVTLLARSAGLRIHIKRALQVGSIARLEDLLGGISFPTATSAGILVRKIGIRGTTHRPNVPWYASEERCDE